MKKISYLLALVCWALAANGSTSITTSTVSGHWTMAGSPYLVYNTITVSTGQALTIDPGVSVIFQGVYELDVIGILSAKGTSGSPINFDIQDTTGWSAGYLTGSHTGGWLGISFSPCSSTMTDTSALICCNFQHMKLGSVGLFRNLHVSHCNFYNNAGGALGLASWDSTGTISPEVENCDFHDNIAVVGSLLSINNSHSPVWYIHDNAFHNNVISAGGNAISGINSRFIFEGNSIYQNNTDLLSDTVGNAFIFYYQGGYFVSFSENRVYENTCGLHGVIFFDGGMADLNSNYICNNQHRLAMICAAADGGGAVFLARSGTLASVFTVRNNVIANNYSPLYGGGIYIYDAPALIANNTIVHNKAPRGSGIDLWMIGSNTVCIKNNILFGNENDGFTAPLSDNVHLSDLSGTTGVKFDHNWTTHLFYADFVLFNYSTGTANILTDTNTNIIGSNPGMISPTLTANVTESALTADFRLLATSACIDMGTDSAVVPGTADHAAHNRIYGDFVDIGAYEYGAPALPSWPLVRTDSIYANCCNIEMYTLGVEKLNEHRNIKVYPNPASGTVFMATPDARGTLIINDIAGKTVAEKNVTGKLTSFDIRTIPRGTYFAVWLDGSGGKTTQKIVVE
jgi:Secretion system C-terminal sorting domain